MRPEIINKEAHEYAAHGTIDITRFSNLKCKWKCYCHLALPQTYCKNWNISHCSCLVPFLHQCWSGNAHGVRWTLKTDAPHNAVETIPPKLNHKIHYDKKKSQLTLLMPTALNEWSASWWILMPAGTSSLSMWSSSSVCIAINCFIL